MLSGYFYVRQHIYKNWYSVFWLTKGGACQGVDIIQATERFMKGCYEYDLARREK